MGDDETALIRLWHEKRGEAEPEDLSGNLSYAWACHRGLKPRWYEAHTGEEITEIQKQSRHPDHSLDGGHTRRPS